MKQSTGRDTVSRCHHAHWVSPPKNIRQPYWIRPKVDLGQDTVFLVGNKMPVGRPQTGPRY